MELVPFKTMISERFGPASNLSTETQMIEYHVPKGLYCYALEQTINIATVSGNTVFKNVNNNC